MSMPYVGLTSLQHDLAFLGLTWRENVSMPYVGLTSLQHHITDPEDFITFCVSMPYVGLTSLQHKSEGNTTYFMECVNALCRAHVSTTVSASNTSKVKMYSVSMPYVGLTSLQLDYERMMRKYKEIIVSMPYVGLTSLQRYFLLFYVVSEFCVNALCRAHVSTTLPLITPSVYAVFRPCFLVYLSELSDFWVQ